MNLILFWSTFIINISTFEEITQVTYVAWSLVMFLFVFLQNKYWPKKVTLKIGLLILNVPITVLWYLILTYNDFLSIYPIPNKILISLYLIYVCAVLGIGFRPFRKPLSTIKIFRTYFKLFRLNG